MSTRVQVLINRCQEFRDVAEKGTDVAPVDVVELIRVHPVVFAVVDLKPAVGWHVGWLDGR
jgi:hypothetical protein